MASWSNATAGWQASSVTPGGSSSIVLISASTVTASGLMNFASDVEARTIGASGHVPILDPGRWPGVDVLVDVPPITSYPFSGSAIFYWDIGPVRPDPSNPGRTIGVPPPPLEDLPNSAGEDPHGAPRGAPVAEQLVSQFLTPAGAITDVCGGQACHAGGWTGP